MPTKNRPAPKPVAVQLVDSRDVVVTKTHDVDAALEALLDLWVHEFGDTEDEALDTLQAYIDTAPTLEHGRWVRSGSYDGEPCTRWKTADPSGRGVTRAVVWSID